MKDIPHVLQGTEKIPSFVNAEQIAKTYNVTPRYILKLASEGRIPCMRLGSKCVRFEPVEVAKALEAWKQASVLED